MQSWQLNCSREQTVQYKEIRSYGELLSQGAQISTCFQLASVLTMSSPRIVHQLGLWKTLSTTSSASPLWPSLFWLKVWSWMCLCRGDGKGYNSSSTSFTKGWLTSARVLCCPSAACPLRLMMWTSWGRLDVPLLAQPDSAVKLFNMACTGCPIPTGSSSHGLRNNGPAVTKVILYEQNLECHSVSISVLKIRLIQGSLRFLVRWYGKTKQMFGPPYFIKHSSLHIMRVIGITNLNKWELKALKKIHMSWGGLFFNGKTIIHKLTLWDFLSESLLVDSS